MQLYDKSATELASLLRKKEVTAKEISESCFARINAVEPVVDSFITQTQESAMQSAKAVDQKIANGDELGVLAGLPIALKDNICTKGIKTTCASRMLENFIPPYNATVVDKLEQQDAIMVGKLNMDEFAMGSSCESSYFKKTQNPWAKGYVPGGSSGGSAAAVAACQVPFSLGTDTGGSIRTPASYCGVVGLKPTYGAVSRFGVVAFASSLDQVGPLARTVDDVALLFSAICGPDKNKDATSKDCGFALPLGDSVKGLRIGVPKEYWNEGITAPVKESVQKAINQLESLGATIVEISIPSAQYALSAYYIISSAEAASNMARFDGVKYGFSAGRGGSLSDLYEQSRSEGFGDEVKRRIMLGTYVLSSGYYDAYYKRARLLQQQITQEYAKAMESCDFILTPTSPGTAFKIDEKIDNVVEMYAGDVCTVTVNIAGLPAISLPCGLDSKGLPIGMQIIGPKFSEQKLLTVAKCYETAVGGFAVKEMEA